MPNLILLNSLAGVPSFPLISKVSLDDLVSFVAVLRPQTQGEEELQLQLALAMSREEADAEDSKKKSDDMRLQMAIAKSKEGGDDDKKEVRIRNLVTKSL